MYHWLFDLMEAHNSYKCFCTDFLLYNNSFSKEEISGLTEFLNASLLVNCESLFLWPIFQVSSPQLSDIDMARLKGYYTACQTLRTVQTPQEKAKESLYQLAEQARKNDYQVHSVLYCRNLCEKNYWSFWCFFFTLLSVLFGAVILFKLMILI